MRASGLFLCCLTLTLVSAAFWLDCRVSRAAALALEPNPIVQAICDSVSPDELAHDVEMLQNFYTRHTNSDTVSATTGIGAARRWIFSRFQEFSQYEGSDLVPGYFDFDATICSAFGGHRNVLATIGGHVSPERFFLLAAHMDSRTNYYCNSTSFAPGADDDGSGTAVLIELARVLSRVDLDCSVTLMAVTGEEQGLFGSTAYATWAVENGIRIDGMLANDTVGNITGCVDPACPPEEPVLTDSLSVRHYSLGPSTSNHRQLTRALKLNGERYLPEFTVRLIDAHDRPGRSGDHFPFDARGYAAARFIEPYEFGDGTGANGRQHNQYDTFEWVIPSYVARIVRLNLGGFANLALAPETPRSPTVETLGNGTLRLTWPSVTTAPDVAGYRVALRGTDPDSLFYFAIEDAGIDAGGTQEYVVGGLTPDVALYMSVSAYDTDNNESIFSGEVLALQCGSALHRPHPWGFPDPPRSRRWAGVGGPRPA